MPCSALRIGEQRVEHGEDERAEDRPAVAAEAAEDRGAADHYSRDRGQQERRGQAEVGVVVEAEQEHARQRAQHPRERVHGDEHLPDANPRKPAGKRVVADGVQHSPVAGVAQAEDDQRRHRHPDQDVPRHVGEEPLGAERFHGARNHLGEVPAADDRQHPERHAADAERHHEWVDPEDADPDAVDEPYAQPDGQGEDDLRRTSRSGPARPPRTRQPSPSSRPRGRRRRSA